MKLGLLVGVLLLIAAPACPEEWQTVPSVGYVNALRVADGFLSAWANRDDERGLALASPELLLEMGAVSLRQYLQGLSNPRHWAFEIGVGTAPDSTRFVFPVVLYEYYMGEPTAQGFASRIEVVRLGDGWCVDRVPPTME